MLHRPADADLAISTGRGNLAAGLTPKATGRFRTRTLTSPLALALEPRFMFDAAGVATGGDAAVEAAAQEAADQQTDNPQPENQIDPLANALSVTAPPADRKEVVFVDPNIQDVDALLAGVHPAAEVVVLTPDGDGLQQIADYMADQTDIDAIHILSHGQEGGIRLGGMTLDLAGVEARGADLATIGDALTADGDILIYGCDAAAGAAGHAFVEALANATCADVAASTDDTGHADQGGDWDLEVTSGTIEAAVAVDADAQAAFQGRLQTTFLVTSALDTGEDATIDGSLADDEADGDGLSLREALFWALDGDTVTFDLDDTTSGNQGGTITLGGTQMTIGQGITIDGDLNDDGIADVTVDGGRVGDVGGVRVFNILADVTGVTLDGLVIQNGFSAEDGGGILVGRYGQVTVNNSTLNQNTTGGDGGGILVSRDADVTITNTTFSQNTAGSTFSSGGGVSIGGRVTIANTTFSQNTAVNNGGGLFTLREADVTITNTTFSLNTAGRNGGGIFLGGDSTLTLAGSTFDGNSALAAGGALRAAGAILVGGSADVAITDTTFDGNRTNASGGAIVVGNNAQVTLTNTTLSRNTAVDDGGAIVVGGSAQVTLTNTTLSGNSAINDGGAILVGSNAQVTLTNTTVSGNGADGTGGGVFNERGALHVRNSIVAGNAAGTHDDIGGITNSPSVRVVTSSNGANIFASDVDGAVDGDVVLGNDYTLDDVFADVGSVSLFGRTFNAGLLADNGGPVQTIAIDPYSIAIDEGAPEALDEDETGVDLNGDGDTEDDIATDARGRDRVSGDGVDIGAVELSRIIVDITEDEVADDGFTSLREALTIAVQTGAEAIVFDQAVFLDNGRQTIALRGEELAVRTGVAISGDIDRDGIADLVLSGGDTTRVLLVADGTTGVALDGLVIRDGRADKGGGLSVGADAEVAVTSSQVFGNAAELIGGGIDNAGSLRLQDTTVSGNDATGRYSIGGGIFNGGSASLTLTNVVISGNSAAVETGGAGLGGGIANDGIATVVNSTLSGNRAQYGGGIVNKGTATLVNTTISGNGAEIIDAAYSSRGGGIFNTFIGDLMLTNTTLSGNRADGEGGGIDNAGGLTLNNSIVAGNGGGTGPDIRNTGTVTSNGANIFGSDVAENVTDTGDIELGVRNYAGKELADVFANVGADPDTGVTAGLLADNGGPTPTIAINPTGLAFNGGDNDALSGLGIDVTGDGIANDPIPVDQLGQTRVVGGAVDIGAVESPANSLASVLVDTVVDEVDGNFSKGNLSLREALILVAPGGIIEFDPGVFPFADSRATIGLDAAIGELVIAKAVTIDGDINDDGIADVTVSGNGATRVFNVTGGTFGVTLDGLVIRDGRASEGGGLAVGRGADATVTNSLIINNRAEFNGGGIYNVGNLSLQDTAVRVNYATADFSSGGGIDNTRFGRLTLTNALIERNRAGADGYSGFGGGIANNGIATVVNSTINANYAQYGGGMFNRSTATLVNSTITGNTAKISYSPNSYTSGGGGIYNSRVGSLTLVNVTISGNRTDGWGGGIDNQGGGSIRGSVTLRNSIVAGNAASTYADIRNYGTVTSNGANIFGGDVANSVTDAGDIELGVGSHADKGLADVFANVGANPNTRVTSGLSGDNGGPTPTIALNSLGIAVNAGENDGLAGLNIDVTGDGAADDPIPVDQRGLTREQNGRVDIGAYEAQLPFAQADAVTTDEDTVLDGNVLAANGGVADSDPEGNPLSVVAVNDQAGDVGEQVTLASGALLRLDADGTFTYDPNGRFDGLAAGQTATDSFTYIIGNGTGGLARATVTITITGVDDAPTLTATRQDPTFTEDGSAVELFDGAAASTVDAGQTFTGLILTVSNVDDGAAEILRIDGTDVALTGGSTTTGNGLTVTVSVSGGTATVGVTGTSLDAAALQTLVDGLTYRNTSDAPTTGNSRAVTITQVTDSGSGAAPNDNTATPNLASTVTLTAVNDAPVVGAPGAALSATEQLGLAIHGTGFTVSDVDAGGGQVTATLSVVEGAIAVAAGNSGVTVTGGNDSRSVTLTGTIAQINALLAGGTGNTGTIVYTNPSDAPAANTTFTVTVNDQGNTGSDPGLTGTDTSEEGRASQTITIAPVNDPPLVDGVPGSITVLEDVATSLGLSGISLSDPDNATLTVTLTTKAGTLSGNAGGAPFGPQSVVVLDTTPAELQAILATIQYTGEANAAGTDADRVTVEVSDASGAMVTQVIVVNITPVNDAPAGADAAFTVVEDTPRTFSAADFGFSDPNDTPANGFARVVFTSVPANGTLALNGTPVTAGGIVPASALGNLVYTPNANVNGIGADSFTFQVRDDGGTDNNGENTDPTVNTIAFDITAVNDAPTVTGPAGPISVPTAGTVTLTDLLIGDVDVTTSPTGGYTVTVTVDDGALAVVTAVPGVTVVGAGTGTLTLEGTLADINTALAGGIAYTAPVVSDETGVTLTATVSDNGNAGLGTALTDVVSVPITVAGDVDPVILATAGDSGTGADPGGVLGQANGDPITTLDNTGGAADPNTDVTPDGGLTGDLAGPAAGDTGSLVLFGVPIADVAAGLPSGTELSGFTGAADLLASLNPAAGPDAASTDEIDLDLHGFPVEELALFLVGNFELSALDGRDAVLNLVAASTDGGTLAERLAVLEMLERLGLFADGSISLAELQGEIGLFGLSLGEMAEALEGVDLDGVTTLAELQAMLGTPSVVEVPTEAGLIVPSPGAPAFTDQLAGAFTAFDRDAAALGAALAQIGETGTRPGGLTVFGARAGA